MTVICCLQHLQGIAKGSLNPRLLYENNCNMTSKSDENSSVHLQRHRCKSYYQDFTKSSTDVHVCTFCVHTQQVHAHVDITIFLMSLVFGCLELNRPIKSLKANSSQVQSLHHSFHCYLDRYL